MGQKGTKAAATRLLWFLRRLLNGEVASIGPVRALIGQGNHHDLDVERTLQASTSRIGIT